MSHQLTNLQKRSGHLPSQLDFLKILYQRGSDAFAKDKKLYTSLTAGDIGETKVLEYIQAHGRPHWTVLRNVWLKHFGELECDILLLTGQGMYLLEVKNYSGGFTYENGKCFFGHAETKLNPIEQARSNRVDLERICSTIHPNLPVKAAVVFAGDDSEVAINTPVQNVEIVTRTGIKRFIQDIARAEPKNPYPFVEPGEILHALEPYEIQNPFMPKPLTPGEMEQVRGGICCADCHNFQLQTSRFYVTCSKCGLSESREEAILRTTCEYGVLTYDNDISRQDLFAFFDGQVSLSLLKKTISEHMEVVKKGRSSYCVNPNVLYEKLNPQPAIKRR